MIIYAGAQLMTGNDIAAAVLNFCTALAEDATAETVDIPVLSESGSRKQATLVIGPASQIVAEDVDTPFDELVDPDVVSELASRTRAHRPVAATPVAHEDGHRSDRELSPHDY